MWWHWATEVDRTVRVAADSDDLPGASAAVGGGCGDKHGRRGRTLTGKGQEPAQRRRQARGR